MSAKKVLLWIVILVFIDQIVKIIINNYFLETRFEIIPSLFEFRPSFNNKGPYVSHHLLNLNIWKGIFTVFYFVYLCLMIAFYALVRRAKKNTTLFDFAFIFGAAAYVCALTGDIFWEKGCLDFIYLKPLFIFDLKDLYINCFLCLVIVLTYKYRQQLRASPKDVIRKLVELAKYK